MSSKGNTKGFLQRKEDKSYGWVAVDDDYGNPDVIDHVDIPKNDELQKHAFTTGYENIERLAGLADKDDEHLDGEIEALEALRDKQVQGLINVYGDEGGESVAGEWIRRGTILADTGNDRNYRSRASTSFPSLNEDDDSTIDIHGWDETVQTAITRERVRGRRKALAEFSDHPQYDKLEEIHNLMTQSSSLSRVPTAGVAGSLDKFKGTKGAHTTDYELGGGSVGTNPMGHRERTSWMQSYEADHVASEDFVSMADRQQTRLETSLSYTLNVMSARSEHGITNEEVLSEARNPYQKAAAMHWGREATKTMFAQVKRDSSPVPPASPRVSRAKAAKAFAEYGF